MGAIGAAGSAGRIILPLLTAAVSSWTILMVSLGSMIVCLLLVVLIFSRFSKKVMAASESEEARARLEKEEMEARLRERRQSGALGGEDDEARALLQPSNYAGNEERQDEDDEKELKTDAAYVRDLTITAAVLGIGIAFLFAGLMVAYLLIAEIVKL